MNLPAMISHNERDETIETKPLLDCGAGGLFIDQNFARKHGLWLTKLNNPIKARNVDGTENKQGTIRFYTDLRIKVGDRHFNERFYVTGLGNQKIILGLPWLQTHNPDINWETGEIRWRNHGERSKELVKEWKLERKQKKKEQQPKVEEEPDEEENRNWTQNISDTVLLEYLGENEEIWINSKTNLAMELAIEANEKKADLTPEQLVPPEYHEYLDVFDEDKANRYPESRQWDHKIEMKEGFEPKSFKAYNLTPEEQIELDKFLQENIEKGYIKP